MSNSPKTRKDLALAPVAVAIDLNLRRLREAASPAQVDFELQLALDKPAFDDTREERARRVLDVALRDVERHGWDAAVTDDASAIRLTGGSVTLDLAVGAATQRFVDGAAVPA